jgi:hypothetical protein
MPQPLKAWKVLPHGKLTYVEENLLTVVGELKMPLGEFPRRMTVARLRDGRLVIFSAIALDESEMNELEHFGIPAFLIVPSDRHRMDAKIWKDRYPKLTVLAPPGAKEKVNEVVPVDATDIDFNDSTVQLLTVPGTGGHEAALIVRGPVGPTLVVNELIWNVDNRPGFGGWLMKIAGFTGPSPQIPPIAGIADIKDKAALREQLLQWSRLHGLRRIMVSHGKIIEKQPARVLTDLAAQLT